jgi:cyclophilin family peptidyl-prolyl cis-trans isomerase
MVKASYRAVSLSIALSLLLFSPASIANDKLTTADVMDALVATDWRRVDPANLLIMRLPHGQVVLELAPGFAPRTVANIRTLVRENYFDGLAIMRSHDNYVAQWGDPAEDAEHARPLGSAAETITPEFERAAKSLRLVSIDSRDAYADIVGFVDGFPAASDGKKTWLTHCYGTLAVARGMDADSGNGSSLYVVTGHSPRHLDRNLTVVGRVLVGMENLSSLPRGTGPLGFYESADERVPIESIRLGTDVPADERPMIDVLRTDTETFQTYVTTRTYRYEDFWVHPTGRIEICNINPPVRVTYP